MTAAQDAEQYAAGGWPVFPIRPRTKTPATVHGFHDATTDLAQIRAWFPPGRDVNVAIRTGAPGPDVLDIDCREGGNGFAALHRCNRAGLLTGTTRTVRTPSGGIHLYFPGTAQPCGTLRGRFVDLKADGGYVLAPPSHVVTEHYTGDYVTDGERPGTGQPLDWHAVVQLIAPPPPPARYRHGQSRTGSSGLVNTVAAAADGTKNNTYFWACCRAVTDGARSLGELTELAAAARVNGLTENEIRKQALSALRTVTG